jgi:hypothetical protein
MGSWTGGVVVVGFVSLGARFAGGMTFSVEGVSTGGVTFTESVAFISGGTVTGLVNTAIVDFFGILATFLGINGVFLITAGTSWISATSLLTNCTSIKSFFSSFGEKSEIIQVHVNHEIS